MTIFDSIGGLFTGVVGGIANTIGGIVSPHKPKYSPSQARSIFQNALYIRHLQEKSKALERNVPKIHNVIKPSIRVIPHEIKVQEEPLRKPLLGSNQQPTSSPESTNSFTELIKNPAVMIGLGVITLILLTK